MSKKARQSCKTLRDIAHEDGRYPEEAYTFIQEALEYATRTIHGPMTPAQFVVAQYMAAERIDLAEVIERRERGRLDPIVAAAIDQAGSYDKLNRNISGQDLCWALRDFALRRWGMMASLALGRWGITETRDFGEIVFKLVEHNFMQKESRDSIDDFGGVFSFDDALDRAYRIADHLDD